MDADRSPELRASDADREAVAQRLRTAHADGRLDVDEVEERLSAAYAAKTYGDLERLTADLGPEPPARRGRARSAFAPWREWAGVAVLLNVIWIITCIAAGELLFYWPMFPVGIWGAAILSEQVFGVGQGDDDEDDDERRRMHGQGHTLHPPKPPEPPDPPRLH